MCADAYRLKKAGGHEGPLKDLLDIITLPAPQSSEDAPSTAASSKSACRSSQVASTPAASLVGDAYAGFSDDEIDGAALDSEDDDEDDDEFDRDDGDDQSNDEDVDDDEAIYVGRACRRSGLTLFGLASCLHVWALFGSLSFLQL